MFVEFMLLFRVEVASARKALPAMLHAQTLNAINLSYSQAVCFGCEPENVRLKPFGRRPGGRFGLDFFPIARLAMTG